MKLIQIKDVSKIESYIDEDTKQLGITVKYEGSASTLHCNKHVDFYFDQFNEENLGLYYLAKDRRIKNLPYQMIKKDAKEFFNKIIEQYPEFLENEQ